MVAIILAGGKGTRLRSVVSGLPKPMAPILVRPFLEYQMDYWINQGVSHFILSVGYLGDAIINHFGDAYKGIAIKYAVEHDPLGTGGGLLLAAQDLTDPFLVLNGDTFIDADLDIISKFHLNRQSKWTLLLFRTSQYNRYMGVDINQNGEIVSLKSKVKKSYNLANGGVYLIDPSALKKTPYKIGDKVSLEDELLPEFVSNGGILFGIECKGRFIDIGTPEDYYQSKNIIHS